MKFYSGITLKYTSSWSTSHVHNYGTTTVNWRVEAPGGIETVSDSCGNNVNFAND